jgi:hypothetical protein
VLPVAPPAWQLAALPDGSSLVLVSAPGEAYRAVLWQYTNSSWSNHGVLSSGAAYDLALRVQGGIVAAFSDAGHGNQVRVLQHEAGLWIDTGTVSSNDGTSVALGGDGGTLLVAWADWALAGSPIVARYAAGWSLLGDSACASGWSEGLQVAAVPDGSTLLLFREAGLTNRVSFFPEARGRRRRLRSSREAPAPGSGGRNPFWPGAGGGDLSLMNAGGYLQALPTSRSPGQCGDFTRVDETTIECWWRVRGVRLFRYR